jgi:tetratricopeptide (TPR) repeat protein
MALGRCFFAGLVALGLGVRLGAADLESFQRKAEMHPQDAAAQFNLALMAYRTQRLDLAEEALVRTVKLAPEDAQAWQLYGTVLGARGKSDEAIDALRQSVKADRKAAGAWMALGKALAARGTEKDLREALAAYEAAGKLLPGEAAPWLNQGLLLARLGREEKAVLALEKAAKLKGGAAAARSLCVLYNKKGDYNKAAKACGEAVKDGDRAEDWYNLGFAQQRLEQKDAARKSLRAALKLDPLHAPSLYNLAFLDFEAGNVEEALRGFKAALKARGGDYPEAQYNAAVLLGDLGRYEEAAELYHQLLKKDAANEDARANLAYVVESGVGALVDQGKDAYERGDFKAAAAAWKRAQKLDPGNEQVRGLLSRVAGKMDKSEKAVQAARQAASQAVARKLKDEDRKVKAEGLTAFKAGKLGEANRLLGFYLQKNPEDKEAQTLLYRLRAQLRQQTDDLLQAAARELVAGRRAEAKTLAAKALALDPGNARARKLLQQSGQAPASSANAETVRKQYYAGVEQYLAGNLEGAIATWREVLKADPQHLDAKRSLARVELELAALRQRGK